MITSKQISEAIQKISKKEGFLEAQKFIESLSKFSQKHFLQSLLPRVVHFLEQADKNTKSSDVLKVSLAEKRDLSQNTERLIREKLVAQDAPLEVTANPGLLAGFIAEYRSVVLDGSAKTQIKKLKQSFNKS